jgi:hypothetical protein
VTWTVCHQEATLARCTIASASRLRALPDPFLEVDQSFVVEMGSGAKLDAVTKFVAEIRGSGFIRAWTERDKL